MFDHTFRTADDAIAADDISLVELKHWELAPFNPGILAAHDIDFAITSAGSGDDFLENLRQAVTSGLPAQTAVDAITKTPAAILGVSEQLGQLAPGYLANFVIFSAELFAEDSLLLENWIRGKQHVLEADFDDRDGRYQLLMAGMSYDLELSFEDGKHKAKILPADDESESRAVTLELGNDLISLSFALEENGDRTRLNGWPVAGGWQGNGRSPAGELISWQLLRTGEIEAESSEEEAAESTADAAVLGTILYPFVAYGRETMPQQQDMLIRGAMVWTNEEAGTLITDVLVRGGRIAEVGDDLSADDVLEIDGSGKHLTPGIVDEQDRKSVV